LFHRKNNHSLPLTIGLAGVCIWGTVWYSHHFYESKL